MDTFWAAHPPSCELKCLSEMVIFQANANTRTGPKQSNITGELTKMFNWTFRCLLLLTVFVFFLVFGFIFPPDCWAFSLQQSLSFQRFIEKAEFDSIQWWIVTKQWPFGAHILKRRISGNTIIQICWTPTLVQHTSVSFISLCFSVLLFKDPEAGFELTLSCSETAGPACFWNSKIAYECVRICVVLS